MRYFVLLTAFLVALNVYKVSAHAENSWPRVLDNPEPGTGSAKDAENRDESSPTLPCGLYDIVFRPEKCEILHPITLSWNAFPNTPLIGAELQMSPLTFLQNVYETLFYCQIDVNDGWTGPHPFEATPKILADKETFARTCSTTNTHFKGINGPLAEYGAGFDPVAFVGPQTDLIDYDFSIKQPKNHPFK